MATKKTPPVKKKRTDVGPGRPPREYCFKPGQSGNPGGSSLVDSDMKKFKNLTKKELVDVGNLVIKGDLEALKAIAKRPGATVLQVMLSAVCVKVVQKGDMHSLDILLNRLVGKVKDDIVVTGNTDARVIVSLPSNGREVKSA